MGTTLRLFGAAAALTGLLTAGALAQSGTQVLPPIDVISATGIPTDQNKIASSVTVITGKDIERDQQRTVPDVLNRVPGLNVVQSGGPGGQTAIFMRGTNSNHVKVLIDGIDVSDPSTPGRTFDFGHLQTYDIERIEVLRGPQSGLYGADAMGGVISITTKKGEGPPKVRAQIEGGSFETFNQAAALSGSTDRFNYAFNFSHLNSGNVPVTPTRMLPPGRGAIGNYYDNSTASTRLGADLTPDFAVNFVARYTDAKLRYTNTEFLAPLFIGVPQAAQSTQTNQQFFTRPDVVWKAFDGRLTSRFGWGYSELTSWTQPPTGAQTWNKGMRDKFDWRSDFVLAPGQIIIVGADRETERLRTSTAVSAQNSNSGVFTELQSEFANRFFLAANIRFDDNERFGNATTWRVAPAFIVPVSNTKLKGSYGTAFKAPSLTQLFVNFPPTFFANPNLRPEKSKGYDVGFEQPMPDDRFRFGVTYFRNDIVDLINSNDTFTTNINIDKAVTYGFESFVAVTVSPRFSVRGDYTYTIAKDVRTDLALLRRPQDKITLLTTWQPIDPLTLSSTVLYVGNWVDVDRAGVLIRPMGPGFVTVNLAASYKINEFVTAFGRVDNLFSKMYEDPVGFLRPGIAVYAGLRLNN